MQERQVQSLGWEDPLEKEMATHSSNLAWEIPWTEEPDRLQFLFWVLFRLMSFSSLWHCCSVAKSCLTLCKTRDCSTVGFFRPSLSPGICSNSCSLSWWLQQMGSLNCGMWDLVPWPGIKPGPPALGSQSLSHWTTREVQIFFQISKFRNLLNYTILYLTSQNLSHI